jgi:hypothetical protein
MRFGDFYTRVCEQLKQGYGWRGAIMYLAVHPNLLDIIYNQYNCHADASPLEWQGIVEATSLMVDQSDRAVA